MTPSLTKLRFQRRADVSALIAIPVPWSKSRPSLPPCAPDLSPIPTYIVADAEAKTIEVANAVLSLDCKTVFFFFLKISLA